VCLAVYHDGLPHKGQQKISIGKEIEFVIVVHNKRPPPRVRQMPCIPSSYTGNRFLNLPIDPTFIGAFAKLRKATISFVMSVRLSTWNKSAPTGRIFMKFHISGLFESLLGNKHFR
jgi:hypothetical protein